MTVNEFYKNRFLGKLKNKMLLKGIQHPNTIIIQGLSKIKDFGEFDERFTAPLHGFANAEEFYTESSSDNYYSGIKKNALIVNALNDPLLGEKCYPYDLVRDHPFLFLETPELGGHVGFTDKKWGHSWMEKRAHEFFEEMK